MGARTVTGKKCERCEVIAEGRNMLKVESDGLDPHQKTLLHIFAQADNRLNDLPGPSEVALRAIRESATLSLEEQGVFTGYDSVDRVYTYIRG